MGSGDLTIIVTPAALVGELREKHPRATTILALVEGDRDGEALAAVRAGADYVLPKNASKELVEATLLLAQRAIASKRLARAFEAALENVAEAIEICDSKARFVWVNRAFETMSGYARAETMGKTPAQLLRSNLHEEAYYEEMWRTVAKDKREWRGSLLGRRADGSVVTELALVKPLLDEQGEVEQFIAVKHFAPSRSTKQDADEPANVGIPALLSSERSFRAMMTAACDAMMIADWETAKFLDVNAAACAMFGYSPAEFRELTGRMLTPPEAAATPTKLAQAMRETGSAAEHRHLMWRKGGERFWAAVSLTTYEFLGRKQYLAIIRDVSSEVAREEELRKAHQQVLHSSRLAALGQMAAGIAHEINNPLQYILGGLEELRQQSPSQTDPIFTDMLEGAERIRNVARALLPFSRVHGIDKELTEIVDVNEVARWTARLMPNELRRRARLDLRLDDQVPAIIGCRVHIGQLITNLLTNAAHAIQEGAEADNRITVTTTRLADARVQLVVEDSGCGIPESVRGRIFEPFFTTKSSEMGTGLGLALCAEIVARHKGTIDVESKVGVGTRFAVTFGLESVKHVTPKDLCASFLAVRDDADRV